MVFVIPEQTERLIVGVPKTYHYIPNWKQCHLAGGEMLDGAIRYSEDMLLSMVLSFIAPFKTQCMIGSREGVAGPSPPSTRPVEENDQIILAIILWSYMTVAKPVTTQNTAAFTKRWQAAIASQNMTVMVPAGSWANIVGLATVFEKAVSNRSDFRINIVDRVLEVVKTGVEGAVLDQIKLVWEYSPLKFVQYMDMFIKSHCRALEIPAVLDQAVLLSERWNSALMTYKNLP